VKYGIRDQVWIDILSTITSVQAVDQVVLYGSRAKGNFKEGSDIDLALMGQDLDHKRMMDLRIMLEELMLPWEIDLLHYGADLDPALKDHIDRVGITLYSKNPNN
jgi:predicted nucleotidyltransferase